MRNLKVSITCMGIYLRTVILCKLRSSWDKIGRKNIAEYAREEGGRKLQIHDVPVMARKTRCSSRSAKNNEVLPFCPAAYFVYMPLARTSLPAVDLGRRAVRTFILIGQDITSYC